MNERTFYSKNFTLKCPVWVVVDSDKFGSDKFAPANVEAIILLQGEPGLGRFLPLFLSQLAAGSMADRFGDEESLAVAEVARPGQLRWIIKKLRVKNVVAYLKKECVRFYRAEDLLEELTSHMQN